MADWSISVVPSNGSMSLNPNVFGVAPGAALPVQQKDLVSWNNQTENILTITVAGQTLTADSWSSTTAYQVQTLGTISYTCEGGGSTVEGSLIAT